MIEFQKFDVEHEDGDDGLWITVKPAKGPNVSVMVRLIENVGVRISVFPTDYEDEEPEGDLFVHLDDCVRGHDEPDAVHNYDKEAP